MEQLKEVFKPIKNYEGLYKISNFGKVKSFHKKNIIVLKTFINSDGYLCVTLCKNKNRKTVKNHILVWDNFGDKKRNGHLLQVDHIDEDKLNNWIDNLQLLTNRENISKSYIYKKKKTSKFIGVSWYKLRKKWVSYIQINHKRKNLGYFKDEYNASLAYQKALKNLGELNG